MPNRAGPGIIPRGMSDAISAAPGTKLPLHRPVLFVLVSLLLIFYAWDLGSNPVYLYVDEVVFALQAHAIATTAHDTNGRLLPLYFQMRQIADNSWFHPAIVYFMAPFVAVLPLSEAVIRFPSVVIGILNVCLMFPIARRIFGNDKYALLAAGLLALTPTHILHSRMAMDYLYPVPFVMAWLLCLLIYLERRQLKWLFIAGLILGFGFYSYIASVVMMPLYLLLTMVVLFRAVTRPFKECLVAVAGFAAPVTIVILWLAANPAVIPETMSRYAVSSGSVNRVAFSDLTRRLSIYWSFFDPGFLFVSGGYTHTMNSTRRVGVFLLPLLVFLPVGFVRLAAAPRQAIDPLLLFGFGLAPLAACLMPEPYAIDRELVVLPFAVLLATLGVRAMMTATRQHWRLAAAALLALIPIHFAFFCFDYWSDYPTRAAYRFQGNRRGVLEQVIAMTPPQTPGPIYLNDHRIPYIGAHWQLYLLKHGRTDLIGRTVFFDSRTLDESMVPPGSLLVTTLDDQPLSNLVRAGRLTQVQTFPEPGNPPLFGLFRKDAPGY